MIARTRKSIVDRLLLLACALLLFPSSLSFGQEAPKRNEKAVSRILTENAWPNLVRLVPAGRDGPWSGLQQRTCTVAAL